MEAANLKILELQNYFIFSQNQEFASEINYRHYKTKDFKGFAY